MKKFRAEVLILGLVLASSPALADGNGNGSPAAGGANTHGIDWDPRLRLTPGRVETRTFEAGASVSAGESSESGRVVSYRANARLPIHVWGKSEDGDRTGVLFDPGLSLRLDRGGKGKGRTELEATGVGVFRIQSATAHVPDATQRDFDARFARAWQRLDELYGKYGVSDGEYAARDGDYPRGDGEKAEQLRQGRVKAYREQVVRILADACLSVSEAAIDGLSESYADGGNRNIIEYSFSSNVDRPAETET
jgi:hypothetical protein